MILSISLTNKTHLKGLFDKTKFQNDTERFGFNMGQVCLIINSVPLKLGHY